MVDLVTTLGAVAGTYASQSQIGAEPIPSTLHEAFQVTPYAGTGSSLNISNGFDFETDGGMVWIKERSVSTSNHVISDTVRGSDKYVLLSSDEPEDTNGGTAAFTYVSNLGSNGFGVGAANPVSRTSEAFISYCFKRAKGFFDIVTYTGNGGTQTIQHNLGSTPGMILLKNLDLQDDWFVWHNSLNNANGFLRMTDALEDTDSNLFISAPTSTSFEIGTSPAGNSNLDRYVAYLFGHQNDGLGFGSTQDVIRCGSYIGSTDSYSNNYINLDFEPQWLLVKKIGGSGTGNWKLFDTTRGWSKFLDSAENSTKALTPDLPNGDLTSQIDSSPMIDGFAFNGTTSSVNQIGGGEYIYVAIRREEREATSGTDWFYPELGNNSGQRGIASDGISSVGISEFRGTTNFKPDVSYHGRTSSVSAGDQNRSFASRFWQNKYATFSGNTDMLGGNTWDQARFDFKEGWYNNDTSSSDFAWMMKRTPGVFDISNWVGDNVTRQQRHGLGVPPELIMIKGMSTGSSWQIWHSGISIEAKLDSNSSVQSPTGGLWNDTLPTSTGFWIQSNNGVNGAGTKYMALVFASKAGISDIGTYTGSLNGTRKIIDCGFTTGARLVIIKCITQNTPWMAFDTARGIASINTPGIQMNGTTSQTVIDVEPNASGFDLPDGVQSINNFGETYVYAAFA
jgi:hypothetical protein